MKRILCLILSALILLACCGCAAGNENEDIRGEIIPGNNTTEGQPSTTAPAETEPEFSMGQSENGVYKNDFLGLTCTVPAGWEFYTDEQILEMNNITADYFDENVEQQIQNAAIVYDMCAVNTADSSSININLEKLNPLQMLAIDVKQVLESQIDAIKSTYANMGYTDTQIQYEKVTVDGKELDGLSIAATIQGVTIYQTIFSFPQGSYLANISITAAQEGLTDDILGYFAFA